MIETGHNSGETATGSREDNENRTDYKTAASIRNISIIAGGRILLRFNEFMRR